ncbi:phage holin family protein [Deinococcus sp. JMULE3]|uniref:phage holin family protein n=1 Tax=Deinococcus sp. JMULE3 TaxID=2518341 RepID=UPI0015773BD8|nr:phage holin family protein [Deinococcus sp. JMULE3]NTX99736.1 phage holin family protein [Deinococcus sp. JMULE3]
MEERKSMGGALVDVFDAGVTLVKSEISAVARKAGQIAKAKGIGAVLLLAATGPLILGLVFIILAVFYGLMRLGLGAWAAALIIAILSFVVTGALIFMGIKKLGADVHMDEPRTRRDSMDDHTPSQPVNPVPAPSGSNAARDSHNSSGPKVELRRDAQEHAAGETRVLHEADGVATVRTEEGTVNVPVYESKPGGEASHYGSGLNKKLSGHHDHDPNLQEPKVLKDAPGISVSTTPTFREDMQKGGK